MICRWFKVTNIVNDWEVAVVERKKKRFVAGAKCPTCNEIDVIQLFQVNEVETIECVSCGYTQAQADGEVSTATRDFEQMIGVFKP